MTSLKEATFPQSIPSTPQQWHAFPPKWASIFHLHGDYRGAFSSLARSYSFLNLFDCKFLQRSAYVYLLYYCLGQHPLEMIQKCGEICRFFNSLSVEDGGESLLFPLPTCQLRQMTAFGAWKHTLSSSLPLCSYRKKLIPKKWNRQKHLPLHLRCAHLSCKRNTLPGHNVVRRQNFDIRTGSLIHVLLQQRKPHFTSQQRLCSKE